MNKPPRRDPRWTSSDRTGGPIDHVFDQLRQLIPALKIERLTVKHPADDDNLYFIGTGTDTGQVQVETSPGGQPPFLIENGGRYETSNNAEAVARVRLLIEQTNPHGSD